MERLGLGPDICLAHPGRLRTHDWLGQTGPLASAAGHDINYISLTGALHAIGNADGSLLPPLDLSAISAAVRYLAMGICALFETGRSGKAR